ncbi:uncharacterized protein LOC126994474 isoform X1 [Eriocheir sinensis]|uniref:uncharacterized protein LOC126994324 isoform X1 n=3 Tax=Eriocheir sinensis TaxID=95602 RepID=UPI0021C6117B|nr:uncharacterized protein LOC126994324 isoform X1 [Eriocheir sinensis]XP_050709743.1 uncharacterized protein LOC126994474 isoform X1 [Eriocheir sinensis]
MGYLYLKVLVVNRSKPLASTHNVVASTSSGGKPRYSLFDFLRLRPQSTLTVLSKWIVKKSSLKGKEKELIQDFNKKEADCSFVCWYPPQQDYDCKRIATLIKNDSNPGPHWLPEPGVIFGQYKTYEECQHVVDEMVSSENVESQALAMLRQCDKEQKRKARTMETNAEETAKEKTAVRPTEKDPGTAHETAKKIHAEAPLGATEVDERPVVRSPLAISRPEREDVVRSRPLASSPTERDLVVRSPMASSTAEREVVRLPLASSQDVNRAEGRRDAIDVFRADTPSTSDEEPSDVQVLPEKQLPQQIQEILNVVLKHVSKKFEEVSKKFEEVKTSVDNLQKQLQPVLPGPSQRVTDGETPLPTGFVPVLPKDPYEVLTYFGFPASTPDSLVSKHRHYFLGNASTEPMRTHRLALRKALVQLCPLPKPQSGKGGLTPSIRQLLHYLAPRDVWVHFCLKGYSKSKRNMESEMPKFVRMIQATMSIKRQVDESTVNAHLSEALRKESDRSGFRNTARPKKTTAPNTSTPSTSDVPGTSGHGTGQDEGESDPDYIDNDAESIVPLSSGNDTDRATDERYSDDEESITE